jgi:hypothetical protein
VGRSVLNRDDDNPRETETDLPKMSRNMLYPVIGVLLIAVGALGYWAYQEQNRSGVEMNVGGRSLTIETR